MMSAPILWILLPMVFSGLLWLPLNPRVVNLLGCALVFFLALAAWFLPIETALQIGTVTIKVSSTLDILGRSLVLTSADRPFLVLVYGSAFLWFGALAALSSSRRLIPLGLTITPLLVASLAVDPFLYAALFIQTAVLLAIPFLAPFGAMPGRGLIRFLIFQTLALPLLLFSGWLVTGIAANSGNLALILQASILLGLGFIFLLAIFPFNSWIPLLAEEASPLTIGFVLWIFPTAAMFFGLALIDRYIWLRDLAGLATTLTGAGILMVASGGVLAALQRHLGRIMGYAVIVEIGYSLLAVGLGGKTGLNLFNFLLVPRLLSLLIWSSSLAILKPNLPNLTLNEIQGKGRSFPFAASGVVLANLSLASLPLLVGFPGHQALWESLAHQSLAQAFWILVGSLGLFTGAMRTLIAFAKAPEGTPWKAGENLFQRVFMSFTWATLILLGLFPEWAQFLWVKLPVMFEHLIQ
jgi:formate hydrogenlyase subunit 3/multisubunit Na+/H+ antiporter MnhD subunit